MRDASPWATGVSRLGQRLSWLLLLAMLPSWTLLGHVHLEFAVPGTALHVGLPGGHDGGGHGPDGEDHERHCHAAVASCSEVPFTGASAFLLMAEAAALVGMAGVRVLSGARPGGPLHGVAVAPDSPPPRLARA